VSRNDPDRIWIASSWTSNSFVWISIDSGWASYSSD